MIESGQKSEGINALCNRSSNTQTIHMCAQKHPCQVMCDEDGICCINVFQKQATKTCAAQSDPLLYQYQEMHGSRKKCAVVLDPGHQTHQGRHSCLPESNDTSDAGESDNVFHYCEARCPCCSYYCTKTFGHCGLHKASHGNMRNTYFVSDEREIDVGGRKYAPGDSGLPEMCHIYCSSRGRSHVHYLHCEQGSIDDCVYVGHLDKRRHSTHDLEPKPVREMDEILHAQFWSTVGWEDPCQLAADREDSGKCSFKCDAPEHSDNASYCILPAWHKLEADLPTGRDGYSYIRGHKFNCDHVSTGGMMHHIFVLDCSGSMKGYAWGNLLAEWRSFLRGRIEDGASLDLVSVVTFDHKAKLEYEAQNITTMLDASIDYRGGRTKYISGLLMANEVISRNCFETYKPVLIFSDGYPSDYEHSVQLAQHIQQCYAKYDLRAFVVGFGANYLDVLESIAEKLGGTYQHALTAAQLRTTFCSISASLNANAGLVLGTVFHDTMCSICEKELACKPAVKLQPCMHEVHKSCHDLLAQQAAVGVDMRCPTCSSVLQT